jgi:DNA-binding XRE family transcriptional regulator
MLGDFDDADTVAEKPIRLTYMGAGPAEEVDPRLLEDEHVDVTADRQVTAWRLRYPEPESLEISTKPGDGNGQTATFEGGNVELLRGRMYVRPGVPAALMLGMAAIWCRGFQVGKRKMNKEKRSRLYRQFHELLGYALENMPQIDATPKEHEDMELDVRDDVLERLEEARDEMTGAYHVDLPAFTVEVDEDEEDAPAPRPETLDYEPDPHTGPNDTAWLLADSFSNIMTGAIMDADGNPAPTKQGKWGRGPGGGPVRVEKLKNPYEGRAVLKVQAHADADPAEVEAAMGWEMLERMDMDTVWLHAVLLGHASAPHRGDRDVMKIPRKRVENALGIRRNRNMTVRERAERVKKHVEALQSLSVQFQGVRRHGDKLHFEGDMTASPLWFAQMKAKGQKDLFTGEVTADWYIQAKEGVWGSEFLHNHGDQWTPLPKEWFEQIDRRGKDWTQRLAVALLFLFRINAKRGGVVKLRAEKMLDICGTDMEGSSRRRTERKRRLSKALDALRERYNIGVEAGRVHIDNTSGISHADWKGRTATFHPPDEMSGELFRNENDGRPPLPDVKGGDWTAAQIRQLRSDLGDTQSEFAEKLGVSRQMVSRYENRHDPPSDDVRKTLDRLDSRFR